MKQTERNSSVELLRIFTMASVLTGHSFGFGAQGEVSHYNLMLMFDICINAFLLISGYYLIRLRARSFLNLAGMTLFYALMGSFVATCVSGGELE